MSVNYKFLINKTNSKFLGYQTKKGQKGQIKIYINNIFKDINNNFKDFVKYLIHTLLVERICIELAFNKIRIKGTKCNNKKYGCLPNYIVRQMFYLLEK